MAERQVHADKARDDLVRREKLVKSNYVSDEDLQHSRDAARTSEAALQVAQQQLAANRALTDATCVETHPNVEHAAAALREASLAYQRTTLLAPVSGYVAKRSVQLGQRVNPESVLMAIVPLDQVWVNANFKEKQLENIRLGQPVSLHADVYGGDIEFHGTVTGLGAGTGSAFALLPAQNATGNWIKVVQRLPVRIALSKTELEAHPLRIGLSMNVEVDTHDREGTRRCRANTKRRSIRRMSSTSNGRRPLNWWPGSSRPMWQATLRPVVAYKRSLRVGSRANASRNCFTLLYTPQPYLGTSDKRGPVYEHSDSTNLSPRTGAGPGHHRAGIG